MRPIGLKEPNPAGLYDVLGNVAELVNDYWRENHNEKPKLIEKRVRSIEISAPEVDAFYAEFSDSLPEQIAAVHLADILLRVTASTTTTDSVRAIALRI